MWCLEGARCCCREPKNVAHARPAPLHRYIINLFKKLVSLDLFCRKGMTMEEIIKHFTGKCFYNKTNCLRLFSRTPNHILCQKCQQLFQPTRTQKLRETHGNEEQQIKQVPQFACTWQKHLERSLHGNMLVQTSQMHANVFVKTVLKNLCKKQALNLYYNMASMQQVWIFKLILILVSQSVRLHEII